MKLTLRKASAIQSLILDKINSITLTPTIKLNEFQVINTTIARAAETLQIDISIKEALYEVFYEIRSSLGKVNAAVGINAKLARLAESEKLIQLYREVANKSFLQTDRDVLIGLIGKLKNSSAGDYRYNSDVTTGILDNVALTIFETKLAELSRQKQKINDEILELNVSNLIELSDRASTLLISFNII